MLVDLAAWLVAGGSGQLAEQVPERIATERRLGLKREADSLQGPENWQKKARLETGFFYESCV